MSGIGGMMQRAGSPSDFILSSLAKSLLHRGPDAVKGEIYDEVGFVYTQLSIIDQEGGTQPLHGHNLALIANAEIYNAQEIKEAFPDYPYKTESDCECILPLYKKYGPEFANHLRGMYTVALYDHKTKTLFLARDPFGIKSLYYWEGVSGTAFASEPQALVNAKILTPQLNHKKIYSLLSFNYIWGNETLFKHIHRVMPGETIVIRKGQIVERLFRDALEMKPPERITVEDSLVTLDKALDQSVEAHLHGDAPYGVLLSGDIDSSCLLKLMSRHTENPIKTFSISLPGQESENQNILNLSKALHTDHQEITFDENDFWSLLPQIMEILDDPTLDARSLTIYKLAREASKSVKVLLSGAGANELFAGQQYAGALKSWWFGGSNLKKDNKLKKLGIMRFTDDSLWLERDALEAFLEKKKLTRLQVAQAIDIGSSLPNSLLLRFDRCLMAHGIEGRTPFLDKGVAGTSFNLPDNLKFKDNKSQWLLREWLQKNSPEVFPFLNQQQAYLPINDWIRSKAKELGPLVAKQDGVKKLCHPLDVEKLFLTNSEDAKHFAWTLLCFALWHQIHIIGFSPQEDVISTLVGPPIEDPGY